MKIRKRPRSSSRPPSSAFRLSQPGRTAVQPRTEPDPVPAQIARTTWFGLLAYLAFVGITLLGVEDADFFVPSRQTQLPLVNVSIPTSAFFWFAPVLGAALYAYLHLQLLKLWEALAAPDPKPGGRHLSDVIYPWLISDYAIALRPDGAARHRPLAYLSYSVTWLLVWAAGPLVLAGFWWRSMPKHDEGLTLGIAVALLVTLYIGLTSRWQACNLLWQTQNKSPWQGWLRRPLFATLCLLVVATSWLRTEGGFDHYANHAMETWETATGKSIFESKTLPNGDWKNARFVREEWVAANILTLQDLTHTFTPPFLDRRVSTGPLATTNLAGVNFIPNPDNLLDHTTERRRFRKTWCGRQGIDLEVCGRLYSNTEPAPEHMERRRLNWCGEEKRGISLGDCQPFFDSLDSEFRQEWKQLWNSRTAALGQLDLSGADLRGADLFSAFLIGVDLKKARLEGANLREARLEGADLRNAQLNRASFIVARLEGADLRDAQLKGADFSWAKLEDVNLFETRIEGVRLLDANMDRANLVGARLNHSDLRGAYLEKALLSRAHLEEANLRRARLDGADLEGALLKRALLENAWLEGANLENAQLDEAYLMDTNLKVANLKEADLDGAFLHGSVLEFADLRGASLLRARFRDAQLANANMSDAHTEGGVPPLKWSAWKVHVNLNSGGSENGKQTSEARGNRFEAAPG